MWNLHVQVLWSHHHSRWRLCILKSLKLQGNGLFVRQHPMKSLSFVCLSSVHPSLTFLKIGSLVFSDIVHYDSWSWYLVTAEARFLKKKKINRQPKFGPSGPKLGPNLGFLPFSQVCFISFPWNHLQQFITCSRGKTHKKFLGTKFGPESGPKSGFFCHFLKFDSLVFL